MENTISNLKKEINGSIAKMNARLGQEKKKHRISKNEYPFFKLHKAISEALRGREFGERPEEAIDIISPPAHVRADFGFAFFGLAKITKEDPNVIAKKVAEILKAKQIVADASAEGGFVNIILEKSKFYGDVLHNAKTLSEHYGETDTNAKKIALIEYSSPNIAKPIGVGHLRSTIIGEALARIYEATGYSVIRENYLGDWGTQFGKVIYAYRAWAEEKHADPILQLLKDLYVRFNKEAAENMDMEDAAREIFAKLESGDQETVKFWEKFRELSMKNFDETYKRFGITFDLITGESYFAEEGQKMITLALEKNAAHNDDTTKAVIVDDLPGIPSFLLRKGDGATLYMARELAALEFRANEFHPQEILDVVGHEQELHFRQAYALAKKLGILPDTTEAKHIGFGTVLVDGKKMSTRKGTLIELDDLISQSVEKSRVIMKEKNPDLDENELGKISEIVGVGAIVYNDLRQSRMKNVSFDWERMLDFEGASAAYLQYTYVRIHSISRKLTEEKKYMESSGDFIFEKNSEFALAKKIAFFPKIILNAQKDAAPHVIATYLEELAQLFNTFYGEVSIIKTEDENLRASRILLIESVALVIKKGLELLNIRVPEKM